MAKLDRYENQKFLYSITVYINKFFTLIGMYSISDGKILLNNILKCAFHFIRKNICVKLNT